MTSPLRLHAQPLWRELLLVAAYNTAIGLFMWVMTSHDLATNLIFSHGIGFSISFYFALFNGFKNAGPPGLGVTLAAIPLGVLQGVLIGAWGSGFPVEVLYRDYPREVLGALAAGLLFGLIAAAIFHGRHRLQTERLRRSEQEALAADAELRLLQARIEPHFLFNTLAVAIELIDTAPPQARQMLVDLVALLRGALATTRRELVPLAEELRLLTAYLDIMSIRMGERLSYRIDLPPVLQQRPVPPLLLQPLVENAIRHGLEPLAAGGSVTLRGDENPDGSWWLEVRDTGRGLSGSTPAPGGGIGLSNVRQRLAQRYGPAAELTLSEPPEGGLCVRLHLPAQASDREARA